MLQQRVARLTTVRITLEGVTAGYGRHKVFEHLTLEVDTSSGPLAVAGENGSGKSTLLKLIAGILGASAGRVSYAPSRPARLAYAPPFATCLPWLSASANLTLVSGDDSLARQLAGRLDPHLLPRYGGRFPKQLSTGTRQKLTLLQALLSLDRKGRDGEHLLLLDEPTRGLDIPSRDRLAAILRDFAGRGVAIVFVAHDPSFISDVGARQRIDLDRENGTLRTRFVPVERRADDPAE